MPMHCTGVGRALLAFGPGGRLQAVLDAGPARVAPRTIVTPGRLSAELAAIREAGVSQKREESGVGVTCVAAPVLGADGTALAAISITGWINRLEPDRPAPAVRTAALGVSRVLRERGRVAAEYLVS